VREIRHANSKKIDRLFSYTARTIDCENGVCVCSPGPPIVYALPIDFRVCISRRGKQNPRPKSSLVISRLEQLDNKLSTSLFFSSSIFVSMGFSFSPRLCQCPYEWRHHCFLSTKVRLLLASWFTLKSGETMMITFPCFYMTEKVETTRWRTKTLPMCAR
jgi:hypothetical protein